MANKVYTSVNYGKDYKDLYIDTLKNMNTKVVIPDEITTLYDTPFWNNCVTLTSIDFNNISGSLPDFICSNCENLQQIKIGKINGKVGQRAFDNCYNVKSIVIDPASNIIELGAKCFAGLGSNLESHERFIFDFRNSTFTNAGVFGIAGVNASSYMNSATMETVQIPEKPAIGISNAVIYLPTTVTTLGSASNSYMPGIGSVPASGFFGCENLDIYFSGNTVVPLESIEILPKDDLSHVFVPYEAYGKYILASNWSAYQRLLGYKEFSQTTVLPQADTEGYAIKWFSDAACQNEITTINTGVAYCKKDPMKGRLFTKVYINTGIDGTIVITNIDTNEVYPAEAPVIPIHSHIKLECVPTTEQTNLAAFLVDSKQQETNYTILEATEEDINTIVVYGDKFGLPIEMFSDMIYYSFMLDTIESENNEPYQAICIDELRWDWYNSHRNDRFDIIFPDYFIIDNEFLPIRTMGYIYYADCIVSLRLPSTLRRLGEVYQLNNLKELYLPDGLVEINFWDGIRCDNLETIYWPKTITYLGGSTSCNLEYCHNLKKIIFGGSIDDFNQLNYALYWKQNYNLYDRMVFTTVPLDLHTINATCTVSDAAGNTYVNGDYVDCSKPLTVTATSTLNNGTLQHLTINGLNYSTNSITSIPGISNSCVISIIYNNGELIYPNDITYATWQEIAAASAANIVPAGWAVGDVKQLKIGDEVYLFYLADTTGKYELTDVQSRAKFTFNAITPIYYSVSQDSPDNNPINSPIMQYINSNSFLSLVDTDLISCIKPVNVPITHGGTSIDNSAVSFKFFMPKVSDVCEEASYDENFGLSIIQDEALFRDAYYTYNPITSQSKYLITATPVVGDASMYVEIEYWQGQLNSYQYFYNSYDWAEFYIRFAL